MNLEKMIETLMLSSPFELNRILDERDGEAFDSALEEAYELVGDCEDPENAEELFIKLSIASEHHDVSSYICDDQRLIKTAEVKNIESPFINYLKESYANGEIPHEWS